MSRINFNDAKELISKLTSWGVIRFDSWDDVLGVLAAETDRPFSGAREYDDYMSCPVWMAEREHQLEVHGRRCEICGSEHNLNVHHITYERGWNPLDGDFAVLCSDCHARVHRIVDGVYSEDYEALRKIYDNWLDNTGRKVGENIAMRMNGEWPFGIPGRNKMRAACIVRDTLMYQKNIYRITPRHDVIMHNLIKNRK